MISMVIWPLVCLKGLIFLQLPKAHGSFKSRQWCVFHPQLASTNTKHPHLLYQDILIKPSQTQVKFSSYLFLAPYHFILLTMSEAHDSSHLKCELKVVRLANFDHDLPGSLYVRYYIFAGNGRRIRIDTRGIQPTSNPCWNELASVECWGALDPIVELLEHRGIVFELRWRRTVPVLGRLAGSKLLGRGKLAWKDVLGTSDMSLERWVSFVTKSRASNGLKSPTLFIEMKVNVMNVKSRGRVGQLMSWKDCGCKHCDWIGSEEDMFQAATIVDGWWEIVMSSYHLTLPTQISFDLLPLLTNHDSLSLLSCFSLLSFLGWEVMQYHLVWNLHVNVMVWNRTIYCDLACPYLF